MLVSLSKLLAFFSNYIDWNFSCLLLCAKPCFFFSCFICLQFTLSQFFFNIGNFSETPLFKITGYFSYVILFHLIILTIFFLVYSRCFGSLSSHLLCSLTDVFPTKNIFKLSKIFYKICQSKHLLLQGITLFTYLSCRQKNFCLLYKYGKYHDNG